MAHDELIAATIAQAALIEAAQDILARYLPPDGISGDEAIDQLLGLLDGPEWRRVNSVTKDALAKAGVAS